MNLDMPRDVLLLAVASIQEGTEVPAVELAIYREEFNPGNSDNRLTGEGAVHRFKLRQFFPSSGCGVYIENSKITYAEPGLQHIIGRSVTVIRHGNTPLRVVLVVWKEDAVSEAWQDVEVEALATLKALSTVFC